MVPALTPGRSIATARANRQLETYAPIPPWINFTCRRNSIVNIPLNLCFTDAGRIPKEKTCPQLYY
jgi:hypothetical protein